MSGQFWKTSAISLAALALAFASPAAAGPMQDFETELRQVYADYRTALFATNSADNAVTIKSLTSLTDKWSSLTRKWGAAAPPQYAEDPGFRKTLETVAAVTSQARGEADAGKLAAAHETLEKIRDELSDLRRRNGVIVFSDHMNAYHAQMEKILLGPIAAQDEKAQMALREETAVLAYLFAAVAANPPADKDAGFEPALKAVGDSIANLRKALESKTPAAIKAAIKALKPPYSRLFLKYG